MITVFCDGACSKNPGPGGWAAIILQDSKIVHSISGFVLDTTNNRMELTGAIQGVTAAAKFANNMIIYTDSIYVKNGITQWIFTWKKNQWKNGTIKNIDLWQNLSILTTQYNTEWQWIKGHSNNKYNDIVDNLARKEIILNSLDKNKFKS